MISLNLQVNLGVIPFGEGVILLSYEEYNGGLDYLFLSQNLISVAI
jgi:hypothetical protein